MKKNFQLFYWKNHFFRDAFGVKRLSAEAGGGLMSRIGNDR